MVYRLEAKKAARHVKKIAKAYTREDAVSGEAAHRKLLHRLVSVFGDRSSPIGCHLESGSFTLKDVHEAEKSLLGAEITGSFVIDVVEKSCEN